MKPTHLLSTLLVTLLTACGPNPTVVTFVDAKDPTYQVTLSLDPTGRGALTVPNKGAWPVVWHHETSILEAVRTSSNTSVIGDVMVPKKGVEGQWIFHAYFGMPGQDHVMLGTAPKISEEK